MLLPCAGSLLLPLVLVARCRHQHRARPLDQGLQAAVHLFQALRLIIARESVAVDVQYPVHDVVGRDESDVCRFLVAFEPLHDIIMDADPQAVLERLHEGIGARVLAYGRDEGAMLLHEGADLVQHRPRILDEGYVEPGGSDAHEPIDEVLQHIALELRDGAEMGIERAPVEPTPS